MRRRLYLYQCRAGHQYRGNAAETVENCHQLGHRSHRDLGSKCHTYQRTNDQAYKDIFEGKNVLLVDDSIVRGTTSAQIIEMAREVGAAKVYFASAAPPVRHPNVYGIDMPAVKEFIANDKSVEEIGKVIGADRLFYQTLEDLVEVTWNEEAGIDRFDSSCFNGEYVTGDIDAAYLDRLEKARNDAAKHQSDIDEEGIDLHNDEEN